jgi:hypothetical protein
MRHEVAVVQAGLGQPGAVALKQAVGQLALRGIQQALPRAQRQVVGQRQRARRLRADDAAEFLEQRLRVQVAQQPKRLAMPLAPRSEHRQRHLAAGRHAQRLQQLAVAEEVDLLLRVLEAQRRMQSAGALRQVGRQRDVQHPALGLAQPRQRDGGLARAGRADDDQRRRVAVGLVLRLVEDDGLVQQLEVRAARAQPAQRRGVGGQRGHHGIGRRVTLDPGLVDHRAAQESRALIGVVLDHLQRQADGLGAAFSLRPVDARELQQQPVRVVELGAVVRPGVELLDVGRAEVAGLDGGLDLVEGRLHAAEVEFLVLQQAHA